MVDVVSSSRDEVLDGVLGDLGGPAIVVTHSPTVASAVVRAAWRQTPPRLRLLAPASVLKDAVADFLVGSRAADLIADDTLALQTTEGPPESQLIVTQSTVIALIETGDTLGAVHADEPDLAGRVHAYYGDVWAETEAFSLRTSPLSEIRSTLRDVFGGAFVADFDTMLASRDAIRRDDAVDIVAVLLLLAAKHEELLYDLAKWGEDTRVAGQATFSRRKAMLEDHGLIATESVPIEIGRPRYRLRLGPDRFHGTAAGELIDAAENAISPA